MKKYLLFIAATAATMQAEAQLSIPNGNFEQWNTVTFEMPQGYPNGSNADNFWRHQLPFNVEKTTDAYHGNYAVKLSTITAPGHDTSFAYFINTVPDGDPSQWVGGMPYNQTPTGIRGYYKYNLATTDSATMLLSFSSGGANIGTYAFTIGGIHNTYTLFDFSLNPPLPQTPDSVIFGALSCKLGDGGEPHGIPGAVLFLDSISLTGVTTQPALFNGDFEQWQSISYTSPDVWYIQQGYMQNTVTQTTDAAEGNYAIALQTHLEQHDNNIEVRAGHIATGYFPNDCNGNCTQQGGYPYTSTMDTLAFYYKYAPQGNDSAEIVLNFKNNGTTIGWVARNLAPAASYQYMEMPFQLGQSPDTVIVNILSSIWGDTTLSHVGSLLKIDEVHFKSQPLTTGINGLKKQDGISVFPNPTSGKLYVQIAFEISDIAIYNMLGEKIKGVVRTESKSGNFAEKNTSEIVLPDLNKGIYFLKVYSGQKVYEQKIVLQ